MQVSHLLSGGESDVIKWEWMDCERIGAGAAEKKGLDGCENKRVCLYGSSANIFGMSSGCMSRSQNQYHLHIVLCDGIVVPHSLDIAPFLCCLLPTRARLNPWIVQGGGQRSVDGNMMCVYLFHFFALWG